MPRRSRLASRAARRRIAAQLHHAIGPVERRYVDALQGVSRSWSAAYMKAAAPLLSTVAKGDGGADVRLDVTTLAHAWDILGVKVQLAIRPTVGKLFDRMAGDVKKGGAKGLRLIGITPSDTGIEAQIHAAREANIALVETAHRVYAAQVRDVVNDPSNFGLRVEDLADKIAERGDVSESRAELIARDQTLKLNADIAQARMQNVGVESYTWSTSLDDRVRDEHAELEGQSFTWDSPPAVGHPGDDIQCRCVAIPNTPELDDIFG